ncbi:hypothetical protein UY3_07330 [Chelonia mydas]|uniref:Uncharacterized protein n=1 Tax=Chelonia mydas TaxID=8469 RepID=M7BTG4_CHEMY|nr:hypothetical protein UY3_07330 [Chelonia mydas]
MQLPRSSASGYYSDLAGGPSHKEEAHQLMERKRGHRVRNWDQERETTQGSVKPLVSLSPRRATRRCHNVEPLTVLTVQQNYTSDSEDRIRSSGLKLQPGRYRVDFRKNFLSVRVAKHWNKLPREVVESPSLEILKSRLDKHLSGMV